MSQLISAETLIQPTAQRKLIDPEKFCQAILKNVYDPEKNTRMVYKFRKSGSYGGSIAIDLMGCSYRCSYCWVCPDVLSGGGPIVDKMRSENRKIDFSPEEAFEKIRRMIEKNRMPAAHITGAETFLTPNWTLELATHLSRYFEKEYPYKVPAEYGVGRVWVATQGFDLMRNQWLFPRLRTYKKHLALFISLKTHPDDYGKVTNVDPKYADVPFQALELAWQHGIVAIPQMLDVLFRPEHMEWFVERLQKIHPNAPRVLEFDRMSFFPWRENQNVKRMKRAGWRFGKGGDLVPRAIALKAWQETLAKHYGKECAEPPYKKRLGYFDCDSYPAESVAESVGLLQRWIFETPGLSRTTPR